MITAPLVSLVVFRLHLVSLTCWQDVAKSYWGRRRWRDKIWWVDGLTGRAFNGDEELNASPSCEIGRGTSKMIRTGAGADNRERTRKEMRKMEEEGGEGG